MQGAVVVTSKGNEMRALMNRLTGVDLMQELLDFAVHSWCLSLKLLLMTFFAVVIARILKKIEEEKWLDRFELGVVRACAIGILAVDVVSLFYPVVPAAWSPLPGYAGAGNASADIPGPPNKTTMPAGLPVSAFSFNWQGSSPRSPRSPPVPVPRAGSARLSRSWPGLAPQRPEHRLPCG